MSGRKREGTRREAIVEFLKTHPIGCTADEIGEQFGFVSSNAAAELKALYEEGSLTRCVLERDGKRPTFLYRSAAAPGLPQVSESKPFKPAPVPVRRDTSAPAGVVIGKPAPGGDALTFTRDIWPPSVAHDVAEPTDAETPPAVPTSCERPPFVEEVEALTTKALNAADDVLDALRQRVSTAASDGSIPLRCALFSDGTLILENLPNCPPIVALPKDRTRELVDYILCFKHQTDAEILKRRG